MSNPILPAFEDPTLSQQTVQAWRQAVFDWLGNLNSARTRQAYAQAWRHFLAVIDIHPSTGGYSFSCHRLQRTPVDRGESPHPATL